MDSSIRRMPVAASSGVWIVPFNACCYVNESLLLRSDSRSGHNKYGKDAFEFVAIEYTARKESTPVLSEKCNLRSLFQNSGGLMSFGIVARFRVAGLTI